MNSSNDALENAISQRRREQNNNADATFSVEEAIKLLGLENVDWDEVVRKIREDDTDACAPLTSHGPND